MLRPHSHMQKLILSSEILVKPIIKGSASLKLKKHLKNVFLRLDKAGIWTIGFLVVFYRNFLGGFFGGACRFSPSCSEYAIETLKHHTCVNASKLIFIRICRCQPFSAGGFDPVPCKRIIEE